MYPSRLFTASDDLLKIINTCSPKAHATRNTPTPPPPLSPSVSLHPPGPRRYVPDPPHLLLKSFSTLFSLPLPLPLLLLLSLSPSGTSQVKQLFPPPHMLTCSLPHPLSSVPCFDFPAAANNTPPFRSSRSPASSFIVPHTLPFILRHTLQLAGHPLLYLLYLSLL